MEVSTSTKLYELGYLLLTLKYYYSGSQSYTQYHLKNQLQGKLPVNQRGHVERNGCPIKRNRSWEHTNHPK